MRTRLSRTSSGYSWLGVTTPQQNPSKERKALSEREKLRLEEDRSHLKDELVSLKDKIVRYNQLSKKYEKAVGTEKGNLLLKQMEILNEEIEKLSKNIQHTMNDTASILKLRTSKRR